MGNGCYSSNNGPICSNIPCGAPRSVDTHQTPRRGKKKRKKLHYITIIYSTLKWKRGFDIVNNTHRLLNIVDVSFFSLSGRSFGLRRTLRCLFYLFCFRTLSHHSQMRMDAIKSLYVCISSGSYSILLNMVNSGPNSATYCTSRCHSKH